MTYFLSEYQADRKEKPLLSVSPIQGIAEAIHPASLTRDQSLRKEYRETTKGIVDGLKNSKGFSGNK